MSNQEEVYSEGEDAHMQNEEYIIEEEQELEQVEGEHSENDEEASAANQWTIGLYLQYYMSQLNWAFAMVIHEVLRTFDRALHLDAAIVVIYSVFQMYRVWRAPQETYDYYVGMTPFADNLVTVRYFSYMMKILINKQCHHENRSTIRNIIFDAFRCQFADIIYPFIHKSGFNAFTSDYCQRMLIDFVWVALMSAFVTNVVKRDVWFRRQRLVWALLNVEYTVTFACGFLHMIEHLEQDHEGNYFAAILLAFVENHFHIGGDWIEELWFGDMSKTTRFGIGYETIHFNMPTYLGQILAVPIVFFMQLAYLWQQNAPSAVQTEEVVIEEIQSNGETTIIETTTTSIMRYSPFSQELGWPEFWFLKMPFKWTVFDYSKQNAWASSFFVATVLAFTLAAIYWQLDFLEQCRLVDEAEEKEQEALEEYSEQSPQEFHNAE